MILKLLLDLIRSVLHETVINLWTYSKLWPWLGTVLFYCLGLLGYFHDDNRWNSWMVRRTMDWTGIDFLVPWARSPILVMRHASAPFMGTIVVTAEPWDMQVWYRDFVLSLRRAVEFISWIPDWSSTTRRHSHGMGIKRVYNQRNPLHWCSLDLLPIG